MIATFNVNAGSELNSFETCSIGYRARKTSGGQGYVTAGHCVYLNITMTDYGIARNRSFGGKMDAAWVDTSTATVTPTNNWHLYPGSTIPSSPLSAVVENLFFIGQNVGKIGRTTKHRTGTITNTNFSGKSCLDKNCTQSVQLTNQVLTTAVVDQGDSGGIVYTLNPTAKTAGIVVAKLQGNNNMIFTRADIINSSFGLSRY